MPPQPKHSARLAPYKPTPGAPRSRRGLVAVLTLAVAITASGCTSAAQSPSADSISVPVLWAGTDEAGNPVAGIEPAGISVADDGQPGYSVDLDGIDAQGAGPSWQAASATAASVGTLFSTVDPSSVSIRFSVTGQIDGPSGGALLTVGVLAALRGQQLREGVTMTGTISPDGTIGFVSSIPEKIRAAADAGFKTVLLPAEALGHGSATNPDSPEGAAHARGIKIVPVRDVGEAYRQFTDSSIEPDLATYPAAGSMEQTQRSLASRLIDQLKGGALTGRQQLPAKTVARLAIDVAAANRQLADSPGVAYGIAASGYRLLVSALAQQQALTRVGTNGMPLTRAALAKSTNELARRASATLAADASLGGLGLNQQLSLPSALSLLSHASATLQALAASLRKPAAADPTFLSEAAGVIAQQRLLVNVLYPDQLTVIKAVVPSTGDSVAGAAFMSGYTNFLVSAGKANEQYLAASGHGQDSALIAGDWAASVKLLGQRAQAIPLEPQDATLEVRQSADALAYFLASAWLVAADETFEIFQNGHVGLSKSATRSLTNSATTADETVSAFAAQLASKQTDAAFAPWISSLGLGATQTEIARDGDPTGLAFGVGQTWAGTTNVLVLTAGQSAIAK